MRAIPRLLLILGFAYLALVLLHEARIAQKNPDTDPSKIVMLFVGTILVGGAAAVVVATVVMPYIGDAVGNFFFSPSEQIEKDPHSGAQAALARGDYTGAVEGYRQIIASD